MYLRNILLAALSRLTPGITLALPTHVEIPQTDFERHDEARFGGGCGHHRSRGPDQCELTPPLRHPLVSPCSMSFDDVSCTTACSQDVASTRISVRLTTWSTRIPAGGGRLFWTARAGVWIAALAPLRPCCSTPPRLQAREIFKLFTFSAWVRHASGCCSEGAGYP